MTLHSHRSYIYEHLTKRLQKKKHQRISKLWMTLFDIWSGLLKWRIISSPLSTPYAIYAYRDCISINNLQHSIWVCVTTRRDGRIYGIKTTLVCTSSSSSCWVVIFFSLVRSCLWYNNVLPSIWIFLTALCSLWLTWLHTNMLKRSTTVTTPPVIILSSFYTCYFMRLHIWSDLTLDRLVLLVVVFHPVCLSAVHTVTIAHHISRGLVGIIKIKYFYEKWSRRVLHTNEVDWWRYSS